MSRRQIRPLVRNPNKHTPRGLRELERSVREDGWVAPITVAADGESLDGAARLEVAADVMSGIEPIVVEHDGKRPVVMVRTDIPNAETPEARRIAYRANRVAELDLDWDVEQLGADLAAGLDLLGLWDEREFDGLVVEPFGGTSTDRNGQGVNSTWDQVRSAEAGKVIIDDIETRLPADVIEMLKRLLTERFEQGRVPIFETMEAVIVAGVRAVEASGA